MKRIVIGLLVAIVLLVAADLAAATAAEYQVSSTLRTQLALPDDPAVKINGFPFLAQAIAGDYRDVEVKATNLTVGSMTNVGVDAALSNVRVPLSDVLGGAVRGAHVDSVQGTVLINKTDLARQLSTVAPISKLSLSPVDDGSLDAAYSSSDDALPGSSVTGVNPDSAVRIHGTTSVLGKSTEVSVIAVLDLVGGQIQVTPRDIRVGSGAGATKLPAVVQAGLRRLFTFRVDPGTLPFHVTPTRLRAVGDGLQVSGVAKNVVLGQGPGQG